MNLQEARMKVLLLVLTFIVLGILSPVLLISIAAPASFGTILLAWTIFAVFAYPLFWVVTGRRRLI